MGFYPPEKGFNLEMSLGRCPLPHRTRYLLLIEYPALHNTVANSAVQCFSHSRSTCPFYLVGSKNQSWFIELYSLISDEEIFFGKKKKVGCEAELIWVGDGKPPAASKVSLLIRGVRFAAKADTEGSFTVSAVHGILALVSVTLGQSHLYPLPWGFSLGGLGFFWTLRRFSSEGTCASKMPAVFSWVSLYVCLFDVSVPMYLSAFSKRPQDATFRTFKGVIRSL